MVYLLISQTRAPTSHHHFENTTKCSDIDGMTKLHETRMTDLEGAKVLLEEDIHELKMINHELFSQVRQNQMELDDFDEHNQIRNIEKRWSHNEQSNQSLLDIIKAKIQFYSMNYINVGDGCLRRDVTTIRCW